MPTYEYACRKCGEHLEVAQSFKDDPLTACPNCGGDLRKVFSPIGIAFKGSGFYKTDSRGSGAKTAAKSEKSEKSETKTESKPEKKTETKSPESKSAAS